MTTAPHSITQLIQDGARTPVTLQQGELFLTIPQFQRFLTAHHLKFSRRSIYRWLNLSKQYLPPTVQEVLRPAPLLWYIQIAPVALGANRPNNIVIPLRYLHDDVRPQAMPLALHCMAARRNRSALESLAELKALNVHIATKILEIEQSLQAAHQ
jgi:hypothetical protein